MLKTTVFFCKAFCLSVILFRNTFWSQLGKQVSVATVEKSDVNIPYMTRFSWGMHLILETLLITALVLDFHLIKVIFHFFSDFPGLMDYVYLHI